MHLKFGCESYEINKLFFSWKTNKQLEDCIRMLKCYKFLFKRNKELGFTFCWPEAARTLEVVSCLFCQHSLFFHGDDDEDWPESFWLKRVEMVGVSWILDLFQCDPTFLFGLGLYYSLSNQASELHLLSFQGYPACPYLARPAKNFQLQYLAI